MTMKVLIFILALSLSNTLVHSTESGVSDRNENARTITDQKNETQKPEGLRIRPFDLEIVPPSSGVQFYRDGIIFLSPTPREEKVPGNHLSFGLIKLYSSAIADTVPEQPEPFNLTGTALFPGEATTFTSDYRTMYLSLIPDKAYSEKIFRADHTSSGWQIEKSPIEICEDNNLYTHPCLSSDGSFMIFSSDMPGSSGGLDLFITRKKGDKWGTPENLGKEINSTGNELFASLDSRNNLYFSSDGHPGKGGYDVFVSRFNGTGWEKPQNLREPVNSDADELGFTISRGDDRRAFFTTRTRSGKYRTQLFIVDLDPDITKGKDNTLSSSLLAYAMPLPATTGMIASLPATSDPISQKTVDVTNDPISQKTEVKTSERDEKTTKPDARQAITPPEKEAPKAEKETPKSEVKSPKDEKSEKEPPKTEKETPQSVKESPRAEPQNDVVIYRVQIIANTRPVGSQTITVAGNKYESYEYLYMGGYRTTIGEFSQLQDATRLQNLCRQNGYKQAFVVAFKNNERSTDPALFR